MARPPPAIRDRQSEVRPGHASGSHDQDGGMTSGRHAHRVNHAVKEVPPGWPAPIAMMVCSMTEVPVPSLDEAVPVGHQPLNREPQQPIALGERVDVGLQIGSGALREMWTVRATPRTRRRP